MPPKQTDPQFKLRLTPQLKAEIEKAAADSGRSMNAEILLRLEQSFDGHFLDLSGQGFVALIKRFEATQQALEELYFKQRDETRAQGKVEDGA